MQVQATSRRFSRDDLACCIAPSYWVDPKSGNDYMLTVQYPGEPGAQPARPARHSAARASA